MYESSIAGRDGTAQPASEGADDLIRKPFPTRRTLSHRVKKILLLPPKKEPSQTGGRHQQFRSARPPRSMNKALFSDPHTLLESQLLSMPRGPKIHLFRLQHQGRALRLHPRLRRFRDQNPGQQRPADFPPEIAKRNPPPRKLPR